MKTPMGPKTNQQGRVKHGYSTLPVYKAWLSLRRRCLNKGDPAYKNYGGRGIEVCERWHKFENFIDDMGDRPSAHHSIDRIDNNGNYEPENCRWATWIEQQTNRRSNVFVSIFGETNTLSYLADKFRIDRSALTNFAKKNKNLDDFIIRNLRKFIYYPHGHVPAGEHWRFPTGMEPKKRRHK